MNVKTKGILVFFAALVWLAACEPVRQSLGDGGQAPEQAPASPIEPPETKPVQVAVDGPKAKLVSPVAKELQGEELCKPGPERAWIDLPAGKLEKAFLAWGQEHRGSHLEVSTQIWPVRRSQGASEPGKLKARQELDKFFGLGISKLRIEGEWTDQEFALIDKRRRKVLPFWGCAEYNVYSRKMELLWQDTKARALERAVGYLRLVRQVNKLTGRSYINEKHQLTSPSLLSWADAQPGGRKAVLTLPQTQKTDDGTWRVNLKSWDKVRGILAEEQICVDAKGKITSHKREVLVEGKRALP